ncbi:MAG: putative Ig domain-containing protein, partial [Bacteroidales bacterium]|nr:putative Ig domain-containing protein [Bacteroidales bacterium]
QTSGIYKWAGGGVGGLHFSSSPVTEVDEMDTYTYNIEAEDTEGLDITIEGIDIPEWLTITDNGDGTALLTGTAPEVSEPVESFSVEIQANTSEESVQQSFTINVNTINQAPEFTSTPELNHVTYVLYEYNVTSLDPDDDPVTLTATTLPSWATFTDNGDGTGYLSGTPTTTSILGFQVVLSVSDGMFETTQSFRVKVTENTDNIAPYFTSTPIESHVTDLLYEYNITAEDQNDDDLYITASILPEWASLVDYGDGTAILSGTPTEVNTTGYEVELKVSDGELEDVQSFFIHVEQNSISDFGMGKIIIYPNPVANILYITNAQGLDYKVFNVAGKCVKSGIINSSAQGISLSEFADGEYILKIFDKERVASYKINKVK